MKFIYIRRILSTQICNDQKSVLSVKSDTKQLKELIIYIELYTDVCTNCIPDSVGKILLETGRHVIYNFTKVYYKLPTQLQ